MEMVTYTSQGRTGYTRAVFCNVGENLKMGSSVTFKIDY